MAKWQDSSSVVIVYGETFERKRDIPMTDRQVDRLVAVLRGEDHAYPKAEHRCATPGCTGSSRPVQPDAPCDGVECIMRRFDAKLTEALGTPYRLLSQTYPATRETELVAHCPSCRGHYNAYATFVEQEEHADWLERKVDAIVERALRMPCGCVDGMSVRDCLRTYEQMQREDTFIQFWSSFGKTLTPRQLDAARVAWSAELKRKQAEAKERERGEVVVDLECVDAD